jgi:hypothetical protein
MQKSSVLVASMAVLKPPQKRTPQTKPTESNASSEYRVLGRLSFVQNPGTLSDTMLLPSLDF